MRVLVCGWIGSTNLGDELVFAGVRRLLGDAEVLAVSIDAEATRRTHGVDAIDHRRLDLIAAAARRADLVVFGGGGLVQDATSPLNLPYHLSRPWLARLGSTPWVGLALGVGPLRGGVARRLAATLRSAAGVSVRDESSGALLAELGVPALLAADAAFHLEGPHDTPAGGTIGTYDAASSGDVAASDDAPAGRASGPPDPDVLAVSLRPWRGWGGMLPVGWRRRSADEPAWFVPTVAAALDRAAERTGLRVRLVAMQTDRDHEVHQRVAAAMRSPAETVVPSLGDVLTTLADAKVVAAMRYHAGIGATLAGRPSVLIGYDPKVDALAATLGPGAARLPYEPGALAHLDDAIVTQATSPDAPAAVVWARESLRERARANATLL